MPFEGCLMLLRAQTFNGKEQGLAFRSDVLPLVSDGVTSMWVERPVPMTPAWDQGGGGRAMENASTDQPNTSALHLQLGRPG